MIRSALIIANGMKKESKVLAESIISYLSSRNIKANVVSTSSDQDGVSVPMDSMVCSLPK